MCVCVCVCVCVCDSVYVCVQAAQNTIAVISLLTQPILLSTFTVIHVDKA